jgi:hypothetical protein
VECIPFSGRGSDRAYFRIRWRLSREPNQDTHSAIIVQYEPSRTENSYFADIAAFLHQSGIPVPRVYRHDEAGKCILLEDLGDTDLWSLRNASWENRQALYRKTLVSVHLLHSIPETQIPVARVRLMEPFGPDLYRWERDYFIDNFVTSLCTLTLESERRRAIESELESLAVRLLSGKRCLIHRDLQSQNVMVCHGSPYLIDFQGMRFGSPLYDLGSLLCDPYVPFSEGQRTDLLSYYNSLSKADMDSGEFTRAFWEASAQRLMQALGAYGFLGLKKGLKTYLEHIPAGIRNLRMAAMRAQSLPHLESLCADCAKSLAIQSG